MNRILSIGPLLASALILSVVIALHMPVSPLAALAVILVMGVVQVIALKKQGFSFRGTLLMAVVAYDPCNEELPSYTPGGECIDEGSGILGFFLVKRGFNISTAITDAASIVTAIEAEDLIVIKDIEAYWPTAAQQTIPGLAGRMERHGHWQFDIPFKHEGVDSNLPFWNNITQKRNYGIVLITEEYKAFAPLDRQLEPVLCAVSAAPGSDQEFGKTRFFQGNVKWKHKDLPYLIDNLTAALLKTHFQV